MTHKAHDLDLPEIPSLPPITMSDVDSSQDWLQFTTADAPAPHQPSPHVSQESFLTAHTSNSPERASTPTTSAHPSSAPAASSLAPPRTLRKSISVDSFVKKSFVTCRPARGNTLDSDRDRPKDALTSSSNHVRQNDVQSGSSRLPPRDRENRPPPPTRSRGESTSTVINERDGVHGEAPTVTTGNHAPDARRVSSNQQSASSAGNLRLPPRLSSASSQSDINVSAPDPIVPVRGSSLIRKPKKQKSFVSLNTHIPSPPQMSEIVIAVIGASGCGKSTVIRKGLKAYGLSEPVLVKIPTGAPGEDDDYYTYTYRTGRISFSEDTPTRVLRVMEVDISELDLQGENDVSQNGVPLVDGVLVCYDASRAESFSHVEDVLREFSHVEVPTVALACKSDLERHVNPASALNVLQKYDVGLVEVTSTTQEGKGKTRDSFQWLLKAIAAQLQSGNSRHGYRNPASPSVLDAPSPSEIERASSATPTASFIPSDQRRSRSLRSSHSTIPLHPLQPASLSPPQSPLSSSSSPRSPSSTPSRAFHTAQPLPRTPTTPQSPSRARSTGDLLLEHEKSRREERELYVARGGPSTRSRGSLHAAGSASSGPVSPRTDANGLPDVHEAPRDASIKDSRAPPWMTLDELLNKLLFVAVSDGEPMFVSHFLLTYRRFASPRSILLAMQKRMRALDRPTGDPMFACFAQMRICLLLDNWIQMYPHDFAVPGTPSALTALVRSILGKTYLLHYGADFIPFLEMLPTLKDNDKGWALKIEDESDDVSFLSDDELTPPPARSASPLTSLGTQSADDLRLLLDRQQYNRERKSSFPLTAKALMLGNVVAPSTPQSWDGPEQTLKRTLKGLLNISDSLNMYTSQDIAQEISRIQLDYFKKIKPRHWLQHVFVQGRKDPERDPIAKYNYITNHIASLMLSLILCHDKPKARAKQIEKFIHVGHRLRSDKNYSGLRAVVAAINGATFEGDPALDILRTRSPLQYKDFQSWDQLLQAVRSHQKYRLALRNTEGAHIPALEIHLSDLIRAHEGNPDCYDDDPSKIHWAKYNMMARFIDVVTDAQKACNESSDYDFPDTQERSHIRHWLNSSEEKLLDHDMQRQRLALLDPEGSEDGYLGPANREGPRHSKNGAILRQILFW
ncbi:ras GEF [Obba rivulosa]|uniref:Ras GEF n=1 Tax=Obba rivulosa TaxID=1052685 RepID=A0A8E2DV76_9APHY|nr:ras GEF [Obba rivulosa]